MGYYGFILGADAFYLVEFVATANIAMHSI